MERVRQLRADWAENCVTRALRIQAQTASVSELHTGSDLISNRAALRSRSTMSTDTGSRPSNHLDLATIRETITYIRDDLSGVDGLEAATAALSMALVNIEQKERGITQNAKGFLRSSVPTLTVGSLF
jgi:hypothetical protein